MPMIDFNAMTIKNLKPGSQSTEYFEKGRNSGDGAFGIRVSPKGKMAWFIMYKNRQHKIKRFSLGSYPELGIKDARREANDVMGKVNAGLDPMAEKQTRKAAPTVIDLWDAYQEKLSQQKKPKAASTVKEENRKWEKVIKPAIGDMYVEDITPMDISDLLSTLAKTSPVNANRLHSLLRVLFKVALGKGWITIHPMQWLDRPGGEEPPRKRVLDDEEIKKLWPFFSYANPNPRDILRLLLLTAQRPGEIMEMRWCDIDLEARTWTQQTNKTDVIHIVPLSPQVVVILEARKNDSQWVFPSRHNATRPGALGEGHTKSVKDVRRKLKELSGVDDWTAHDLRRTARTIMSRLRIKQHIRERVLNHTQGGVSGVYDQFDYLQEKADALEKLGREIMRIVGVKTSADIITLRTAS